METRRLTRSFLKIAMTAFLLLLTGHAFAIDNKTRVVSPYWQVDTGSYSFIAVSHSSLSGMASQIGLTVTAIDNSGTSYGTAQDFTITQGATQRVFIVPEAHTTINPTSQTDSDITFIRGTSTYTHGQVRIDPKASHPEYKYLPHSGAAPIQNGASEGFRDITMLTYWGSVVIEQNTTGFAMEFIGDLNSSQTGQAACQTISDPTARSVCPTSGVNLQ